MLEKSAYTPPPASPSIVTLLSQKAVHEALLEKINGPKFEGRNTYVGGSEVGGCAREVAWKKVDPSRTVITDPMAAGRMLAGNVLENTIVQLVRGAWEGTVRETGHAQAELVHETAPLRCHPDGKISWRVEWYQGMRIAYLDDKGQSQFLLEPPQGPGTMEIKTASGYTFRRYVKEGLPARYKSQTQVEMGLSKTGWTLLVLVNRENMAEFVTFLLFFDEAEFEKQVFRSHVIMNAVDSILQAAGPDPDVATLEALEAKLLPEAEPERGWCDYCAHRDSCPARAAVDVQVSSTATFPEDVAIEAQVKAEEYLELKPSADRCEKLKDQLKDLFIAHGVESAFGLLLARSAGRTSVDTKRLEAEHPDLYASLLKKGADSFSLKIARTTGPKRASKAQE